MRNILLNLQFVGTNYAGWQRQQNATSIQAVLEKALSGITGTLAKTTGCSRTDAGVHAEQFIVNFCTESNIPAEKFAPALQSHLPPDILIQRSREVRPNFDARRNSYEKTYRYQIVLGRSPFFNNLWWQVAFEPDMTRLERCARLIVGRHDFSGFCVMRSLKENNICCIKHAAWKRTGKKLYFRITGDRFLHHMVRFLVGAQLEVACGKIDIGRFKQMIEESGKVRAKFPAPPEGLYLEKVKFR